VATTETRLLLLGAVSIFEPVNGYQIRRELLSWGVEEWANIRPGSIYNGLATLAQRGELVRHDLRDGGREVAVYELSDAGREEFHRLFEPALTEVRPTTPLAFQTAMSLLPMTTRERAAALLTTRLQNLDRAAEEGRQMAALADQVPPHVVELMDYWERMGRSERDWLVQLIAHVGEGALTFRDEAWQWEPAADDPGWQMQEDRQRYLALLGR
jgi:DNA-binding PadR family transcriptional regulator